MFPSGTHELGTPGAKIPCWCTRIRGAWLIKIGTHIIHLIPDACAAFSTIQALGSTHISLLFAQPEICPDLSCQGLPIVSSSPHFTQQVHDQLNNRLEFSTVFEQFCQHPSYQVVDDGGVLNTVTRVMKLTRVKLIKQPNWDAWLASKYLQLDQYDAQSMFDTPVEVGSDAVVFLTVWTYAIKALDGRYKARCTCDGSLCSGQGCILDETCANCVDQTGAKIFYSVSAVENLLIFGADFSNAFAKTPPPNRAFTSFPTKRFLTGGSTTKSALPFLTVISSLFFQLCRVIRSPLVFGRNMRVQSCMKSAWNLQLTNPAYTTVISTAIEFFFSARLMTLLLPGLTLKQRTSYLICWMKGLVSPSNVRDTSIFSMELILHKHGTTSRSCVNCLLTNAVTRILLLGCLRISWPLPIPPLSLVTRVGLRSSTLQLVILTLRHRLILPSI